MKTKENRRTIQRITWVAVTSLLLPICTSLATVSAGESAQSDGVKVVASPSFTPPVDTNSAKPVAVYKVRLDLKTGKTQVKRVDDLATGPSIPSVDNASVAGEKEALQGKVGTSGEQKPVGPAAEKSPLLGEKAAVQGKAGTSGEPKPVGPAVEKSPLQGEKAAVQGKVGTSGEPKPAAPIFEKSSRSGEKQSLPGNPE